MTHKITRLILFSACTAVLSMYTAGAVTCNSLDGDALNTFISVANGGTGANTSCVYGGFTFSDFTYTNQPGSPTAAQVGVFAASNADGYGLSFDASWTATTPGSTSDGDISFVVTETGGGPATIEDSGVAESGFVTGNGDAAVTEQGCSGTGCIPGTWGVETFVNGAGTQAGCLAQGGNWISGVCDKGTADAIFTPTGSVTVSKDINSTANTGTASVTTVTDTFSTVPEPRALSLLLGFGILGGLFLRKKFQSVKA